MLPSPRRHDGLRWGCRRREHEVGWQPAHALALTWTKGRVERDFSTGSLCMASAWTDRGARREGKEGSAGQGAPLLTPYATHARLEASECVLLIRDPRTPRLCGLRAGRDRRHGRESRRWHLGLMSTPDNRLKIRSTQAHGTGSTVHQHVYSNVLSGGASGLQPTRLRGRPGRCPAKDRYR